MLLFFDILMILDQSEQNLTGFLQTVKIGGAESYAGGRSTYVTVGALSLWENSLPHVGVLKDARQVWAVFQGPPYTYVLLPPAVYWLR